VWIVDEVRVHTVKAFELSPGDKRDVTVAYFKASAEQMRVLIEEYGKENVPLSILGLKAFPLIPNSVLWHFVLKEGNISETYTAFEVHPI
jgi:hypothetical protein